MNGDDLIKLIPKWAKKIGSREATKRLVTADVGASTAGFMVRGDYHSTPGEDIVLKIKKAMGDYLADRDAS